LSYLCAARPIILSGPESNAAARIIRDHATGAAIPPKDTERFVETVLAYLDADAQRQSAGENARRYAQSAFDVKNKADEFEAIFRRIGLR
jgi:colanic acid biosynthesis glycosyl transferase WcaI